MTISQISNLKSQILPPQPLFPRPQPLPFPMSSVATQREVVRRKLKSLYAPVVAELEQVEQLLRTELRNEHACVDELAQHAFRLGGKRLRPALVLLSGKACGGLNHDHTVLAAVVEMIHTATLVHDDILDEATLRRHLETVNSRWGNKSGVLLGDYLFTHAFYLASTLSSTFACRMIGRATNIVCEGELRQIHTQGNFSVTEADYLSIIEAKTAELCSCCCSLGAHYAGAAQHASNPAGVHAGNPAGVHAGNPAGVHAGNPAGVHAGNPAGVHAGNPAGVVESLGRFGRNLGIAFQIADDLLDVWGDEDQVGKSLGTDLDQQKPTLPLIHLLAQLSSHDRADLISSLQRAGEHAREVLAPWFARTDALAYAHEKAASYAALARDELAPLPSSPAKSLLEDLADFVVTRRD